MPPRKKRTAVPATPEQGGNVAESMQDKRTEKSTKKTYGSRIKQTLKWFVANRPDCLNNSNTAFNLPIPTRELLEYFGHLCMAAHVRDALKSPEEITEDMDEPLSTSTVVGHRSAIIDLYTNAKMKMDARTVDELDRLVDGYEKTVTSLKSRGLMKLHEGKRPFSASGYFLLADKFMRRNVERSGRHSVAGQWSTTMFGWTFFVIMWNLMSRSDSVDHLMLPHVDWIGDALIITEHGQKADKKGENTYGKHIYANPLQPQICPILALGVHIFCSGYHPPNGRQQIFQGTDSKSRFSHLLLQLVHDLSDAELQQLGCARGDVGTHSERKGSSSYCLGQVGGPSPVSVFLRMGQSLGKLKDRYIYAGDGADELCGRMVCGLPFTEVEFGILPPHFSQEVLNILDNQFWNEIVAGYDNYPESFQTAFPFLLASVIHHEKFLRDNLPRQHPLWNEGVFSRNKHIEFLRGKTLLGIGVCKATGMKASGIPPHLAIANQLRELTATISALEEKFNNRLNSLDQLLPTTIASEVCSTLRQNFVVDGVAPITIRDIDGRLSSHQSSIRSMIMELIDANRNASIAASVTVPLEHSSTWWKTWNWHDGLLMHFVPKDWSFPTGITVKNLWDLWYHGNRSDGIRPYRLINKKLDVRKKDYMIYSRATVVLKVLYNILELQFHPPMLLPNISSLGLPESDLLFAGVYKVFISRLYKDTANLSRKDEISYGTAYKLLTMHDTEGNIGKKRTRHITVSAEA